MDGPAAASPKDEWVDLADVIIEETIADKKETQKQLRDFYKMKKQEIKKLSKDEILKNIDKLKKDLFNFRFQKINSQVTNPSKIGETKKTIARLKTSLRGKINA